jgi:hypothetical protein
MGSGVDFTLLPAARIHIRDLTLRYPEPTLRSPRCGWRGGKGSGHRWLLVDGT